MSSSPAAEQPACESALHENIQRKGSNSYYYAHGNKANGPAWDGKEEPRLLSKTAVGGDSGTATPTVETSSIHDYAWTDEKKSIRVYIDFENASSIEDDRITVSNTEDTVEFAVHSHPQGSAENADGNATGSTGKRKKQVLKLYNLQHPIESVTYKKKSDKFVLSLKKVEEQTWYALRKSGSSS